MEDSIELWWRILVIIVVLGALAALWLWINRDTLSWEKVVNPPARRIKILERHWLASQVALFLVEVDGQAFLLARTQGGLAWQPLENHGTQNAVKSPESTDEKAPSCS